MKKKVFLIPLAMFMAAGTVSLAGCGEQKPDPTPVVQKLDSISVSKLPTKLEYNAGDAFDPTGLEVTAKYSDGSTKVLAGTDYTLSPTQSLPAGTTKVTVSYEEDGVSKTAEIGITVHAAPVAKVLSEIVVATQPTQTHYVAGDDFNPEGMSISAKYSDDSEATIAGTDYTISPLHELAAGTDHVTITYEEGGVSKSVNVAITVDALPVEKVLKDIIVDIDPNKTDYLEHEDFDPEGMEVYAIYTDESRKEIFGNEYTIDPLHDLAEGTDHVTVYYTEGDVTKTATVAITVTKGEFVPVERVKYALNPQAYTIEIGDEIGITIEIEPENATNKNVTYEFSNPGIVSIEDGKIKGLSDGQTDITIASVSNPDVKTTIKGFTVTKVAGEFPEETANGLSLLETNNLESGDTINIAGVIGDKYYGMGPTGGNYIQAVELEISDEKLVTGDNFAYTVFKNNDGTFLLRDKNGKFVTAPGGGNNAGGADGYVDAAKFNISISDDGVASIVGADEGIEQRFLSLNPNNGSPRFSCYKAATASTYAKYVIYQKDNEEEPKSVDSVAFLKESYEVDVGSTIEVTAKVSPLDAANQEITYSLAEMSEEGVASISGSKVSGLKEGTAKIVATSVDGSKVAEVALTINAEAMPEHAGTLDDPYTAADAVIVANKLASGKYTSDSYYIKGVVTSLIDSFDPTYGNYSFWLDEVFEGYRLLNGSGKAKFNDGDIEVGDTVTVYSQIQNYNGIAENKNGYVYNVEKPAVPATGISLDNTELSMEVGSVPQQLNATVAPEKASQEVIWSSSDESKVTVVDGLVTAVAVTEEETPVIITAKVASNESLTATCSVTVTPKTRTMTGITATGLEKTEYTEGEKLDLTGLVVQAVYDSGDPETITTGYTTNIALDHKLELTDTSLVISYEGFDADPITLTVSEPQPIVAEGTYVIKHVVEGTAYYLKENGTSAPLAVTDAAQATIFRFKLVDETLDTYTIKTLEGKYLYSTKDNNGVRVGSTEFSWIIEAGASTLGGAFNIKQTSALDSSKGETERFLTLYNNQDFRTYTSATAGNRKQNSDLESVVVKEVDHIAVEQEPTKKSYYVGDTIDLTGLVVRAYYTDGTDEIINNDKLTVSPKTFQAAAEERDITVTYQEKNAHFKVEVKEDDRTITSIEFATGSDLTKKEYYVGDAYQSAGLSINAVRSDGTKIPVTDGVVFEFEKENAELGDTTVDVTAKFTPEGGSQLETTTTIEGIIVSAKPAPVGGTATASYPKDKGTTNMTTDPEANAKAIGLDSALFSVVASKNTGSGNLCGLNNAGYMALYCNKNTSDGGSIEFIIDSDYIIDSIVISWKQNEQYAKVTDASGNIVTATDDVYVINGSSFKIQDVANQSSSTQVHIYSIEITYSVKGA